MAPNCMVVTSQPLAAQAGVEVLRQGGNAIDAAVATAGVLSLTEPTTVGVAPDLFAVIYIAREHKAYVLNASGAAPTGATLEHLNALGYHWERENLEPASAMPRGGILPVTVPGTIWGWDAALRRFGTLSFKEVLEPAARYARNARPGLQKPGSRAHLPRTADTGRRRVLQIQAQPGSQPAESRVAALRAGRAGPRSDGARRSVRQRADVSGVQVIQYVSPEASMHHYRGGSDFRKDGQGAGW